jgi:hypothetical protein
MIRDIRPRVGQNDAWAKEGVQMKIRRQATSDDEQEVLSGDPWTWEGGTVSCRWCHGSWNHEDDCAWVVGRRPGS